MTKRNKEGSDYTFPCGRCLPCVKRKKNEWAFRMDQESKLYPQKLFVTFTYSPEYVPKDAKGRLTLDKAEFHKTIRSLRDLIRNNFIKEIQQQGLSYAKVKDACPTIRYYYRGEYGGTTERPHYHLLLLSDESTKNLYRFIAKAWTDDNGKQKGHIQISEMSEGRIKYTLKYVRKGNEYPKYEGDLRATEFVGMSKGIGANYLTDAAKKWHIDDLENRVYAPGKSNRKYPLPRYYKDRIYNSEQKGHLKGYFEQKAEKELQENLEKYGTDYYRRKAEADLHGFKQLHKKSISETI